MAVGRATRRGIALTAATAAAIAAGLGTPAGAVRAAEHAVSPDALRALARMTDYIGGLGAFTVHTRNTLDEVSPSGEKVAHPFEARLSIRRPDRVRADRRGDGLDQLIVYDGGTLSIFDRRTGYYASVAAPDDIDGVLHFARDALDIVPPTGDIVFSNAHALLTSGLTSGRVVGREEVDGVATVRLAFGNPLVGWEIWIAEGERPLPVKYVLTTLDDPARPQFEVRMSEWDVSPRLPDSLFVFEPPPDAKQIDFLRVDRGAVFDEGGAE